MTRSRLDSSPTLAPDREALADIVAYFERRRAERAARQRRDEHAEQPAKESGDAKS